MRISPSIPASVLLHFFAFTSVVHSAHLHISIAPAPSLPQPASLPPSTHATLLTTHSTYRASLSTDNAFTFRNVSAGSYLLDVSSSTHEFQPLRVDVSKSDDGGGLKEVVEAWGTFRGNEWENKGEVVFVLEKSGKDGREGVWELEVKVKGAKEYYMPRNTFSPLAILKNPMILIAGFSMLIIFGMPYLLDNMDPELKAEFEKQQKSGSVSGMLAGAAQGGGPGNFDAAAWLAGSGKKDEGEKGVSR